MVKVSGVTRSAFGATVAIAALVGGCATPQRLSLHQPNAAPSQRHLDLRTTGASRAVRGERSTCVLKFPLPGQADGPPAFLVYLDMPGTKGVWPVNAERSDCSRGFLIQTIGQRRGKTVFHSGDARIADIPFTPRKKRLTVDILADDGTRLVGQVVLRDDESDIAAFERRHAADVSLLKPESADEADAALTSDRSATQ